MESLCRVALRFINLELVTNHGDNELIDLRLPGGENEKFPEAYTKIEYNGCLWQKKMNMYVVRGCKLYRNRSLQSVSQLLLELVGFCLRLPVIDT